MRKLTTIFKVVTPIFSIGALWVCLIVSSALLTESENNNLECIPNNANTVIIFDGKKFVSQSLSHIIFSEDHELIQLIEGQELKLDDRSRGINYNSNIVLFEEPISNTHIFGVLFNLSNKKQFVDYYSNVKDRKIGIATTDNIGLVITEVNASPKFSLSSIELEILAQNKLLNKEQSGTFNHYNEHGQGNLLKVWMSSDEVGLNLVNYSHMHFDVENDRLIMNGEVNLSDTKTQSLTQSLQPSGLHISSKVMSKELNDSLNSISTRYNLKIPEIACFDVSYRGASVSNDANLSVNADFDLLLGFSKDYNKSELLNSLNNAFKVTINEKGFVQGDRQYYVSQISAKEILISSEAKVEMLKEVDNRKFVIEGDLTALTNVEASGMTKLVIEMIPAFAASKLLFANVSDVQIELINKNDNHEFKGEIEFKDEKIAINELIKFLLRSGLVSL